MRFVSWNVNGLRACMQKGFMDFFNTVNADFFCLQETKLQDGQIALDLNGYEQYWNYAEKKGYSGTAIFTKHTPLSVTYGMNIPELDTEGRLITLEYPEFYLVTCYTPNAQRGLARIDHRLKWEAAFRNYLTELDSKKPVILCGDLNVAHNEIDLKNPGSNRGNAGFSDEERDAFSKLLACGFTDSFRYLHPDTTGAYTWWSYMFNARQNNAGWRIDYFVVSDRIKKQIFSTPIYSDILGSDHCPVGLDLDIPCNGGIWPSFENTEAAPKTEETGETKSSGIKAAAALLCIALLLTGIYFFIPKPASEPTPSTTVPTSTEATQPIITPPGGGYFRWVTYDKEPGYMLTAPSLHSSVLEISGFFEGDTFYELDKITIPNMLNFWIRVYPTDLNNIAGCDLNATVIDIAESELAHTASNSYCEVSKYRDEDGKIAGWFVYGHIERDAYVYMALFNDDFILQPANARVSPILDADDAKAMSTEALVDYAVHLSMIDFYVKMSPSTFTDTVFIQQFQYYPALLELSFRSDARYCLRMHGENYPSCSEIANTLSGLIDSMWGKLDRYRDYFHNGTVVYATQELIDKLARQPELETFINEYRTILSSEMAVYQILRHLQPAAAELENQTDAAQLLLENYSKSPVLDFLLMQPEFLSKLSIAEAGTLIRKLSSNTGGLTTADLVHVITCIRDVRLSLQYSAPYNYENLRLQFPEMQILEQRDGVIIQLLGYATAPNGFTDEQVATAKALLKTDYYYSKMTEAERLLLDHGPILYGDPLSLPLGSLATAP